MLGGSPEGLTAIDRIDAGERHDVYRASLREPSGAVRQVVVRILRSSLPEDVAMAEREARVLQMLDGAGAPRLYDFRLESEWFERAVMCLEWVGGRSVALADQPVDELTRLGAVVGRLHARRIDDLAEWLPPPPDLASYAEDRATSILAKMASAREPLAQALRDRLGRAASVVEDRRRRAPTMECFRSAGSPALLHGDIGPGNFLWATDPVLIDWEYARIGDPADEVAYLFDQNGLDASRRRAFWAGYRSVGPESPVAAVMERTAWWEPVQLLGSTLWWAERFIQRAVADGAGRADPAVPAPPQHYLSRVIARLDRFDSLEP